MCCTHCHRTCPYRYLLRNKSIDPGWNHNEQRSKFSLVVRRWVVFSSGKSLFTRYGSHPEVIIFHSAARLLCTLQSLDTSCFCCKPLLKFCVSFFSRVETFSHAWLLLLWLGFMCSISPSWVWKAVGAKAGEHCYFCCVFPLLPQHLRGKKKPHGPCGILQGAPMVAVPLFKHNVAPAPLSWLLPNRLPKLV